MPKQLYYTRITGCPEKCKESHCCATCANYRGGIEIVPMTMWVTCKAIKGKDIAFRWGPKPYIDGERIEECEHWAPYRKDGEKPVKVKISKKAGA